MESYRIDRFGSVDGIALRSSEDPRLGPKEVLMRVRASSLSYRDLMVLKGGGRGPTKSRYAAPRVDPDRASARVR
jgi:NADPH:quinone reductase-like Zn-dependent oxidoreductase